VLTVYVLYSEVVAWGRVRRSIHYVGQTAGRVGNRLSCHAREDRWLPGELAVWSRVGSATLLGAVEYYLWLNLRPDRNRAAPPMPASRFDPARHRDARAWVRRRLADQDFGWVAAMALRTPWEAPLEAARTRRLNSAP
jgi:hypothetical protein